MEALEFLKAAKRRYESDKFCHTGSIYLNCDLEGYVKGVEKWAKDHPAKTRQTEFLKMFPNVEIREDGFVCICPCNLDKEVYDDCESHPKRCDECFKRFWNEEVE